MLLPQALLAAGSLALAIWCWNSPTAGDWLIMQLQIIGKTIHWQPDRGVVHQVLCRGAALVTGIAVLWLLLRSGWLLSRSYRLDAQQIVYDHGILSRSQDLLELYRVRDITVVMPLYLALFGYGHCILYTSDPTTPVLPLYGLPRPQQQAQLIRDLYHQAMHRSGMMTIL
ncbi:MAG: PH domain-containing protein [Planctomycetota bacterium]